VTVVKTTEEMVDGALMTHFVPQQLRLIRPQQSVPSVQDVILPSETCRGATRLFVCADGDAGGILPCRVGTEAATDDARADTQVSCRPSLCNLAPPFPVRRNVFFLVCFLEMFR
jgi:hypothetical protein